MIRNFKGKSFVLNDESYFSFSKSEMTGNDIYYSPGKKNSPPNVKYKFKKKFERKVMLTKAFLNLLLTKWINNQLGCVPEGTSSKDLNSLFKAVSFR